MVAFWAAIPPKPDQLCKLQIIASLELAVITVFAVTYLLHLWRHYREVQPDAEQYLAASWLPIPGHDYSRSAVLHELTLLLSAAADKITGIRPLCLHLPHQLVVIALALHASALRENDPLGVLGQPQGFLIC